MGERVTERKLLFESDTPITLIMHALLGTDVDDPEIAEVERMSDEEIAKEAAEIRARLRREGHYVVGP
jgi:hypothetical protein